MLLAFYSPDIYDFKILFTPAGTSKISTEIKY